MRLWRSTTNWHFTVDVEDPSWRQGRPLEVIPDVIKVKADGPPPAGDYFHGPVPLMRAPLVRALSSLSGVQLQTAPARLVGAAGKDAGDDLAPLLVVNIIGCASIAHGLPTFFAAGEEQQNLLAAKLGTDARAALDTLRPALTERIATEAPPAPLVRLAEWNQPIVVDDEAWSVVAPFGNSTFMELHRVGDVTGTTLSSYLYEAAG